MFGKKKKPKCTCPANFNARLREAKVKSLGFGRQGQKGAEMLATLALARGMCPVHGREAS